MCIANCQLHKVINHAIVAFIVNAAVVIGLIKTSWEGNDKAIILVIFFYPLLTLVNGLVWMALGSKNKPESKVYRGMTIGLLIMFLPVLFIASSN